MKVNGKEIDEESLAAKRKSLKMKSLGDRLYGSKKEQDKVRMDAGE